MGGMMGGGGMWAWILLWIILGIGVVVTAGAVVVRALVSAHKPEPPQIPTAESPAVREAKAALKMRYAKGEIEREEYLQGKVELED
jgi:putative membrane protein